jgi:histidinol-phosphate aminotransferase
MAFADPAITGVLNRIKYPYNVNGLSQDMILRALDYADKKEYLVMRILKERSWLQKALSGLAIVETIFPTQANFLLVRFTDARHIYTTMLEKHVLLRDRSQHPLTRNCLRITVGSPEENKTLIKYLKQMDA